MKISKTKTIRPVFIDGYFADSGWSGKSGIWKAGCSVESGL